MPANVIEINHQIEYTVSDSKMKEVIKLLNKVGNKTRSAMKNKKPKQKEK